jgi:UDP-N-acetylglucosamine diphosphorylase/glucosamine-1-phosphate N-acetyltransferase
MRVCLFEDCGAVGLEPLAATRPVFDLLCGQTSLGAKQVRYFSPCKVGALIRPHLADCFRLQQPRTHVNDLDWLRAEPTVLVNGRWLPPAGVAAGLSGPSVALSGGEVAYAVVGADQLAGCTPETLDDCLRSWQQTLPRREAGGTLLRHLWDLIQHNPAQLDRDFRQMRSCPAAARALDGLAVVGPRDHLLVDPTARLDPLVVVDTTAGSVVIDREAVVHAFTRIEGPCYVGPGCVVLGAKLRAGTTLGPQCRVGGEVEASILHGHGNKYHDGFLGHSYLGEWVNLGAGTSNSDLRNDYGEVTVVLRGEPVKTGQAKVGSFLGDHCKTAIGTLLNTGTSVGAFCNLVPAGPLMAKYLPPFTTWWNGRLREAGDLTAVLETAAKVMGRRGCALTEAHAALYRGLFEATAAERRRALHDAEHRRLRRSA